MVRLRMVRGRRAGWYHHAKTVPEGKPWRDDNDWPSLVDLRLDASAEVAHQIGASMRIERKATVFYLGRHSVAFRRASFCAQPHPWPLAVGELDTCLF
jgi:hypothetical protein